MGRLLIVVDMQNDFVTGSLGSKEAQSIVPNVVDKINEYCANSDDIIFTMDTHEDDYLKTEEGKNLSVKHCLRNSEGWSFVPEIDYSIIDASMKNIYYKRTFGSYQLMNDLYLDHNGRTDPYDSIELVGLCTDICVISNAVIAKTALPDTHIIVDAACCAGTSIAAHDAAITTLKSLQVEILNEGKEPWR